MANYKAKWYDSELLMKMLYIDKKMSVAEIADYCSVSDETVRKMLRKYGLVKGR